MDVRERIEDRADELTGSEAKLCAAILSDYPFSGLQPIQTLSATASVSTTSISRFVTKIGFRGYQEFQRQLIAELKEGQRSPVDLHRTRRPTEGDYLADFVGRTTAMAAETKNVVTTAQFDRLCALLSDDKRRIFVIGGRISDTLAQFLSRHLKQIRSNVFQLPADTEAWPDYLLRMRPRDMLLIVDFRRYQPNLATLMERAAQGRKAHTILITDKWISPAARSAREVVALPIDIGTAWDSYVCAFTLIEAVLTRISENRWDQVSDRLRQWDDMRLDMKGECDDP